MSGWGDNYIESTLIFESKKTKNSKIYYMKQMNEIRNKAGPGLAVKIDDTENLITKKSAPQFLVNCSKFARNIIGANTI